MTGSGRGRRQIGVASRTLKSIRLERPVLSGTLRPLAHGPVVMKADTPSAALVRAEIRVTGTLAGIFALRMFGLFLLLPVFAVIGAELPGATPLLVGLAIGAYGLMQALLQIPFGMLSDRFGRRLLILLGLLLFVAGSLVAANAETIYGVILGRLLQGAGAIAGVVMALVADVVSERHRTRAMAVIGMSVGLVFLLALITAPPLAAWLGLSGLFWLNALLAGAALLLALIVLPGSSLGTSAQPMSVRAGLRRVLGHVDLWRLNGGIFVLHLVLTATFVVVPALLVERHGWPLAQHGFLYLGVLVASLVGMAPLILLSERRGIRPVKLLAVLLLAASLAGLALSGDSGWQVIVAMWLFFVAFNLLEALMPSTVGRVAPAGTRGTALGVYSSCQFLGVFCGGVLGGLLAQWQGAGMVFWVAAGLALAWAVWIPGLSEPSRLDSRVLALKDNVEDVAQWHARLLAVTGVREALVLEDQRLALLKVEPGKVDEQALAELGGVAD